MPKKQQRETDYGLQHGEVRTCIVKNISKLVTSSTIAFMLASSCFSSFLRTPRRNFLKSTISALLQYCQGAPSWITRKYTHGVPCHSLVLSDRATTVVCCRETSGPVVTVLSSADARLFAFYDRPKDSVIVWQPTRHFPSGFRRRLFAIFSRFIGAGLAGRELRRMRGILLSAASFVCYTTGQHRLSPALYLYEIGTSFQSPLTGAPHGLLVGTLFRLSLIVFSCFLCFVSVLACACGI